MDDDGLWQRLSALEITPPGAALSFARRLARENAWSLEFAEAVIVEYKKFLYLIAHTREELTPSDEVDQAWHLHLVYTRAYWQDLCEDILGFPLHHQPTEGGSTQGAHYREVYAKTLVRYAEVFGEPPSFIWPEVEKRFSEPVHFARVNHASHWMIRKPRLSLFTAIFMGLTSVMLTACSLSEGNDSFWFWLKVAVGVWGFYIIAKIINQLLGGTRGRGGRGGSGCGSSGCSGCCGCGGGD